MNKAKSLQIAESNLLADEKGLQHGEPGSFLVIHLYYRFITGITGIITLYHRNIATTGPCIGPGEN